LPYALDSIRDSIELCEENFPYYNSKVRVEGSTGLICPYCKNYLIKTAVRKRYRCVCGRLFTICNGVLKAHSKNPAMEFDTRNFIESVLERRRNRD